MIQYGVILCDFQINRTKGNVLSRPLYRMQNWTILDDLHRSSLLQLEPVATTDSEKPFLKATYHLEGDGLLAFESYEIIATVQASVYNNHHPNVTAVARQLSAGNSAVVNQIVQYALSCIQPGLQYFTTQLGHRLREPLTAFKAARLLIHKRLLKYFLLLQTWKI